MVGKHSQQGVVELSDGGVLLSDVAFSVDVAVAVVASAAAAVALPVEVGVAGVAVDVSPMFVDCVVVVAVVAEDVGIGVFAKSGGLMIYE